MLVIFGGNQNSCSTINNKYNFMDITVEIFLNVIIGFLYIYARVEQIHVYTTLF